MSINKRTVVLTRPDGQNSALAHQVESMGHRAVCIPWLRIDSIWGNNERLEWWALKHAHATFVFVSAAAVVAALPLPVVWPEGVWAVATGPGTALALREAGVPDQWIRAPELQFDSEGVWAECRDCFSAERAITIFRGQTGRAWLGDQATEAGCSVEYVTVYQRTPCMEAIETLTTLWQNEGVDALVLTNSEAIRALAPALPSELWRYVTVLVPHPRIKLTATEVGAQHIVLTEGGDDGLCKGLRYWLMAPGSSKRFSHHPIEDE